MRGPWAISEQDAANREERVAREVAAEVARYMRAGLSDHAIAQRLAARGMTAIQLIRLRARVEQIVERVHG